MRAVFSIHIWISAVLVVCSGSRRDRNKFHHKSYAEQPNTDETINICDLVKYLEINLQCHCNSETYANATEAKCWLFNSGEKEDAVIWEEFSSQPKLRTLNLNVRSTMQLTYIPTVALSHLPELKSFYVIYGNITRIVPYAFANLTNLESLDLKHNSIAVLEKYSFANLPSLQEINLGNNMIKEISRDIFKNLPSLKRLYLDNNRINVIQDLAFNELKNLEELELYSNQFRTISRNTFSGLTSLKRLDFHANYLEELKDFTFAEMPNLVELRMDLNSIEYIGEKVFYALKNLDQLIFSENKLHILPESVFLNLPHLRVLNLRDNLLQTFTYDTARPIMNKLKNDSFYFSIEGNRLECDCNLSWLRMLANETASSELRDKLLALSCFMKGHYYTSDLMKPVNPNGLTDRNAPKNDPRDSADNNQENTIKDNVDHMLKLFDIPVESLPCPQKMDPNDKPLKEQISKNERASESSSIVLNIKLLFCLFLTAAFVL